MTNVKATLNGASVTIVELAGDSSSTMVYYIDGSGNLQKLSLYDQAFVDGPITLATSAAAV